MPLTEPFSDFLNSGELATTITYSASSVNVIWDEAYLDSNGMESVKPNFTGKESDFSAASQGSTIIKGGTTYVMKVLEPDGHGWIHIILNEQ